MFTFTKVFSPGLPNLGVQIRCDQIRYTTVQTNIKYLLVSVKKAFNLKEDFASTVF